MEQVKKLIINGKMVKDFKLEYDIDSLYELVKSHNDIDQLLNFFSKLKQNDAGTFKKYMNKLKVLFILTNEFEFISTASLIFNEFKLHSTAPLIVAKLLSGDFDSNGGTLLFSLLGLNIKHYREELHTLWFRDITWEMKQKLEMLNIKQEA